MMVSSLPHSVLSDSRTRLPDCGVAHVSDNVVQHVEGAAAIYYDFHD